MNKPFKNEQISQMCDVMEERKKIRSGYYININRQLEILTETYNSNDFEDNPFANVDHNTKEYLAYLKSQGTIENKNIQLSDIESYINDELQNESSIYIPQRNETTTKSSDIEISNNHFENVLRNMSSQDIEEIEYILNDSIPGVSNDLPISPILLEKEIDLKYLDDYDGAVAVPTDPSNPSALKYNLLELGVAETLVNLHRDLLLFLEDFEEDQAIQNEIFYVFVSSK